MNFPVTCAGEHGSELFPCIKNGVSQYQQTSETNNFRDFIYATTTRPADRQIISAKQEYYLRMFTRKLLMERCRLFNDEDKNKKTSSCIH